MNGEKTTITGGKFVFGKSGEMISLRGDILKKFTDFKFNTSYSPVAKLIIDFMDEIRFDKHARGKSFRDRNLIKNYIIKRAILASVLKSSEKTTFVSESPIDLCDRIFSIIQEKQAGIATNRFDNEIAGLIDEILQYKCITSSQHKQIIWKI